MYLQEALGEPKTPEAQAIKQQFIHLHDQSGKEIGSVGLVARFFCTINFAAGGSQPLLNMPLEEAIGVLGGTGTAPWFVVPCLTSH